MTDPASALDHIYACSGAETAATYLAQAPGWARALRDVRERDALNPHRGGGIGSAEDSARWDAEHGTSDRVILPAGHVAELTTETHIQIAIGGGRWEFGTWRVRAFRPDSHAPEREILQLVTGDDWIELLYERGTWTLGDGTLVHLDREEGLWAAPRPAPPQPPARDLVGQPLSASSGRAGPHRWASRSRFRRAPRCTTRRCCGPYTL